MRLLCKNLLKEIINQRFFKILLRHVAKSKHSQINQPLKSISMTAFV